MEKILNLLSQIDAEIWVLFIVLFVSVSLALLIMITKKERRPDYYSYDKENKTQPVTFVFTFLLFCLFLVAVVIFGNIQKTTQF